ncbi:helix-turn-helix domain-containing protein [Bradyrhizobium sp. CCGUVB1N3]|uniref:helix-turn-helix domain-containing protein n=1 Tax=Bradyrhizobium sp. CCGUVB1N3 TaxID=2949629 RepID=UPI0020B1CBD1|nr:helix-turn-helix transcriptional regulator [Bradyrhizobium sp. CCGUVB1N3]MCP3471446.1 helix-turn-helix domain-containing protein [Bradyrhizobium sp. CCGUVB1N3]MCP3472386.1 helix-turn-helix domain-containing protein [Bradyrhizobium sp. CCGUVB1N3]
MRRRQKTSPRAVNDGDRELGRNIRSRRLELHISQSELGEALGVSFQQIQKYEKGTNRVAAARLGEIAAFLKTTVAALIGGDLPWDKQKNSLVSEFVASRDGIDLIEAWSRVESQQVRRSIISLTRSLAAEGH